MANLQGNGAPQKNTVGTPGDIYTDLTTGKTYKLMQIFSLQQYGKPDILEYLWSEFEEEEQGTTDYSALENKPKINNVELSGNKTAEDLNLVPGDVLVFPMHTKEAAWTFPAAGAMPYIGTGYTTPENDGTAFYDFCRPFVARKYISDITLTFDLSDGSNSISEKEFSNCTCTMVQGVIRFFDESEKEMVALDDSSITLSSFSSVFSGYQRGSLKKIKFTIMSFSTRVIPTAIIPDPNASDYGKLLYLDEAGNFVYNSTDALGLVSDSLFKEVTETDDADLPIAPTQYPIGTPYTAVPSGTGKIFYNFIYPYAVLNNKALKNIKVILMTDTSTATGVQFNNCRATFNAGILYIFDEDNKQLLSINARSGDYSITIYNNSEELSGCETAVLRSMSVNKVYVDMDYLNGILVPAPSSDYSDAGKVLCVDNSDNLVYKSVEELLGTATGGEES